MTTLFAIKDAVDLKLYKINSDGSASSNADCVIDFLNDVQIQLDSEQVYATKKGDNYISFSSGRTGTLTMNAEVIDINFLCMMLGGTMGADNKISVSGDIPNQAYKGEGTFRVTTPSGDEYKKITFYNLKAQVSADLQLSATDVSSFSLVLDILANATGQIIDIETTTKASAVDEPRVISFIEEEE